MSRRKEIKDDGRNEKEIKEIIAKFNKTKSWFFEKINKINKSLARLIKEQSEKPQINKIRKKKEILQQTSQKYEGSWNCYEQLYANKMDNLEKRTDS